MRTRKHVLFLDIDGVVNNRESMREGVTRAKKEGTAYTPFEGRMFPSRLNPTCVSRLNRLVKEGDFDVVLSSTWISMGPWDRTSRFFRQLCGVDFDLIGAIGPIEKSRDRGIRIQKWREENNDDRSFIILDDDSDLEPHLDRWIKTDHERGLQDADVELALEKLKPKRRQIK